MIESKSKNFQRLSQTPSFNDVLVILFYTKVVNSHISVDDCLFHGQISV